MANDNHEPADRPADPAAIAYGCASCAKTSCFRGDFDGMPKTCPTRTHADVATDPAPYLESERAAIMHAADATPFSETGDKRNRVQELIAFAQGRACVAWGSRSA